MNLKISLILLFAINLCLVTNARRTSGRSRGSSGRSSTGGRRTQAHTAPTSFGSSGAGLSYAPSAPKLESRLSGWQANSNPVSHGSLSNTGWKTGSNQQSALYPSSRTGLSGSGAAQNPPSYQQTIKQSHSYPQSNPTQQRIQQSHSYPTNNQQHSYPQGSQGHGYPGSSGLSGSGSGINKQNSYPQSNQQHSYPQGGQNHGYPTSGGLSGSGTRNSYPHPQNYGNNPTGYQQRPPPQPLNPVGNYGHQPNYGYQPNGYGHQPVGYGHQPYGYGHQPFANQPYGHQPYGNNFGGLGAYGPSGFAGYNKYGSGLSRTSTALKGLGIAGASIGTVLTGLALWNLARSSGSRHVYVHNDDRGVRVPVANGAAPPIEDDPILKDLINCTLTIQSTNASEVLAIPCNIASSFSPNANVKDSSSVSAAGEETKCIITLVTRTNTEYTTTIPCSTLVNTAKEANVTEPPPFAQNNPNFTGPPSFQNTQFNQTDGLNGQNIPYYPNGQYVQPLPINGQNPQPYDGQNPQPMQPYGFNGQYTQPLQPTGLNNQYPQPIPPNGFDPQNKQPNEQNGYNGQVPTHMGVPLSPLIYENPSPQYSPSVNSGVSYSPLYPDLTIMPLNNSYGSLSTPNAA